MGISWEFHPSSHQKCRFPKSWVHMKHRIFHHKPSSELGVLERKPPYVIYPSISNLSASPSSAAQLASNPPPPPALRCTSLRMRWRRCFRRKRRRREAARQGASGCPGAWGSQWSYLQMDCGSRYRWDRWFGLDWMGSDWIDRLD